VEWWLILLLIFLSLIALFLLGVPVAVAFLTINIVCAYLFWGGGLGLRHLTLSIYNSISSFALLPVPLFVLMGEIMFHSGVAPRMLDVLDKWIGRLPGRLGIVTVMGGTLFATLTGSAMASAAMLGSVLLPEMRKRGYKNAMSLGPILGSGGLAIMIPPSALGVLLAAIARLSIGDFLVAIMIPGLLMGLLYTLYVIGRGFLQPHLAPAYETERTPFSEKMKLFLLYVLPLGSILFLVVGFIFLGIATPTESAALGAAGCFVLAFAYRGLNWSILKKAVSGSVRISVMMFIILTGSTAFSQILGYTGAAEGLVKLGTGLELSPMVVVVMMQFILLIMGAFMEPLTILMISLPVFMPVIKSLGLHPIWFGVVVLLNMEMANTSPPFGLTLFVVKGVAPEGTTMKDIYLAGLPFLMCDAIAMAVILIFPQVVLWLPGLMR
jgi:tripartite ATP-independent transporter DctM subunit